MKTVRIYEIEEILCLQCHFRKLNYFLELEIFSDDSG